MRRIFVSRAILILGICLVTGFAAAGDCKLINTRVGAGSFLGGCSFEGNDYAFCIDSPLAGTFHGTWHYYGPADNFVEKIAPLPDFTGFWAGWALDVIETADGEVRGQDAWMINFDAYGHGGLGNFVSISFISGGTGVYEGATGWFAFVGDEVSGGTFTGEICTPSK